MKKCYPFLALLLVLCQASLANIGDPKNPFDNPARAISFQIANNEKNSIPSKKELAKYQKQMAMMVPSTGTEYDVKYYRIDLRINPDTAVGNYVKGKVTMYFKTTQANFTTINMDMHTALNCDSVYYHNVKVLAGNINRATADLLKVTIPNIPSAGTLDSVSVWYKGVPPAVPGMAGTGYVTANHSSGPVRKYVYTLSEPYSSYTWWPCKSFIVNDKADSMDMFVSTPLNFKSAGNGTRMYEITSAASVDTYWKERYPISAYQVCVAVANYVQYPTVADTVTLSGVKMPVYNLIFPETNTAAAHTSLDRVPLMITTYSALFGDYPFKNEKYGNYSFGFGGGMEHNTFSGESTSGVYTSASNWDVLAHELGHQWWGDNVTCGSWHDIWLNESFADYSEALLLEFAPSIAASVGTTASGWRGNKKSNSLNASYQAKTTYVLDTADILTIFTPSVYIYDRGGMIITMMRTLMGDTRFFQGLKNYQSDPLIAQGNGLTADMKRNMEAASGINLTTFFNNWIYNTGYARYSGVAGAVCEWNNSGNNIVLKLTQKTQSSAITHFDMPVVVRIQGVTPATMDTTVVVYDQAGVIYYDYNGSLLSTGGNLVNYRLSFTPTTITLDPFNQVMASGTFSKNPALVVTPVVLATDILTFSAVKEGSTGKLNWTIDNALDYTSFEVERSADGVSFKNIGSLKSTDYPNQYNFTFIDNNILAGTGYYRIKVIQKSGAVIYTKTELINNKAVDNLYAVSPNPASDYIIVTSGANVKDVTDIQLFDAAGREVKKITGQSFTGSSSLKISTADLGIGTYFLKISGLNNANNYTKQISIIR
jgi:aminopeptidase N